MQDSRNASTSGHSYAAGLALFFLQLSGQVERVLSNPEKEC